MSCGKSGSTNFQVAFYNGTTTVTANPTVWYQTTNMKRN